ncbi:ubiquitin thioesterase OTUB1 isoform X2 [Octopus bimaculoides]|uniref:ubiquitin thioesterase OTUB1 isoform X2 n=1 Tax=Octopus bimaculoides TaxID=37653 RepID=UPI0022E984B3|nr:ubiquitin thioesterase OTUB1 isoform X2 [Octopus bimaculoides]
MTLTAVLDWYVFHRPRKDEKRSRFRCILNLEHKNYDEETLAQQHEIEMEVVCSQPLMSDRLPLNQLMKDYAEGDYVYQEKLKDLQSRYRDLRRTRGDGNCFYRAFGFSYLEKLLDDKSDLPRFKEVIHQSKEDMVNLGFPQFTLEDFYDTFVNVISRVESFCTHKELFDIFNDQGVSDYLVVYWRLLASGYLQRHEDFFSNFVEGHRTVKEFCGQEVEPMGKESDHIHITALTSAVGIPVRVEYMDRGEGGSVNHHDFPENSKPTITLLYRPGHYDILY